jgi:endogenous inhibitor of DNA gyrase (YacG/DUF329 family)
MNAPPRKRIVVCPGCRGESVYSPDNPFRPFCSERCKNMDFGAWASEAYRVASKSPPQDDGEPAPSTPH